MKYFDYGATTPVDKTILEAYNTTTNHFFANATSVHRLGQESFYMYEKATQEIKTLLNIPHHNVVYTFNATEANNLAILGYVKGYKKGKIITSKIEHASVFEVMKQLEKTYEVIYLDTDETGHINIDQFKQVLSNEVILVSIMWVNNVVGTIQDIQTIIECLKSYPKVRLHVDAVQGLGKIHPQFRLEDIDLFTFTAHKMYGPKGIAALCYQEDMQLHSLLYGSSAQFGIKPGTFDLSLVVCLAKTLKMQLGLIDTHHPYVKTLWLMLYQAFKTMEGVIINTPQQAINYYVFNVSIQNVLGETMVHHLEQEGIYVSTGSACSSKLAKPEKTIYAMTQDEKRAQSSIRITLSHLTTIEDVEALINSMRKIVKQYV